MNTAGESIRGRLTVVLGRALITRRAGLAIAILPVFMGCTVMIGCPISSEYDESCSVAEDLVRLSLRVGVVPRSLKEARTLSAPFADLTDLNSLPEIADCPGDYQTHSGQRLHYVAGLRGFSLTADGQQPALISVVKRELPDGGRVIGGLTTEDLSAVREDPRSHDLWLK